MQHRSLCGRDTGHPAPSQGCQSTGTLATTTGQHASPRHDAGTEEHGAAGSVRAATACSPAAARARRSQPTRCRERELKKISPSYETLAAQLEDKLFKESSSLVTSIGAHLLPGQAPAPADSGWRRMSTSTRWHRSWPWRCTAARSRVQARAPPPPRCQAHQVHDGSCAGPALPQGRRLLLRCLTCCKCGHRCGPGQAEPAKAPCAALHTCYTCCRAGNLRAQGQLHRCTQGTPSMSDKAVCAAATQAQARGGRLPTSHGQAGLQPTLQHQAPQQPPAQHAGFYQPAPASMQVAQHRAQRHGAQPGQPQGPAAQPAPPLPAGPLQALLQPGGFPPPPQQQQASQPAGGLQSHDSDIDMLLGFFPNLRPDPPPVRAHQVHPRPVPSCASGSAGARRTCCKPPRLDLQSGADAAGPLTGAGISRAGPALNPAPVRSRPLLKSDAPVRGRLRPRQAPGARRHLPSQVLPRARSSSCCFCAPSRPARECAQPALRRCPGGADWTQQYGALCRQMLGEFGPFLASVEHLRGQTRDSAKLKSILPYLKIFENIKAGTPPLRPCPAGWPGSLP